MTESAFALTTGAPSGRAVGTVSDGNIAAFNVGAVLFSGAVLSGGADGVATVTVGGTIPVTAVTNPLVVSANSGALPAPAGFTLLEIAGANGATSRLVVDAFGGIPLITGRRAEGTAQAPTALAINEGILNFTALGYGATAYSSGPRVQLAFATDEAWTDTAQGTRMSFSTTAAGGTTLSEGMRLSNAGALLVGTTAAVASEHLRVVGGSVTDTLTINGGSTGTFTANGTTAVSVSNTLVTANSIIIPTLKSVGGTVGALPSVKTITPSTGFTVAATASDTSVYNYVIIS